MNKKILSFLLASSVVLSTQIVSSFSVAMAADVKVDSLVDVTPNHWAYNAVKLAVEELGILTPKSATRFNGNDSVTRYELAQTFYNLSKKLESSSGKDLKVTGDKRIVTLTDVDAKSQSVVNSIVNEYGIMQAMPGNKFLGNEKMSRYELAFELDNYLKLLVKKVGKVSLSPTNNSSALNDIKEDFWATPSVKNVVDSNCQVMSGYPDNSFKGQKNITRYELAAILKKFTDCVDKYLIPMPKATPTPELVATPEPTPVATPTPEVVATPEPTPVATSEPVATKKPLSPVDLRLGGALKMSNTFSTVDTATTALATKAVDSTPKLGYLYGPMGQLDFRFGALQLGFDGNYMMYDKTFQDAYAIPGYSRFHAGADIDWRMMGSESEEDASFVLGVGAGVVGLNGSGYNYMNYGPRGRASLEIPVGGIFSIFAEDRFLYAPWENKAFIRNVGWVNDATVGLTIPASTAFSVQLAYVDTRYLVKDTKTNVYGDIGGLINLRFRF